MRERFVFPIVLILGLALYLPALSSGTFILDDGDVIAQATNLVDRSLLDLFIRSGGSTYYRPVLMLSYMGDITLWDANPGLMHLVNLLLHIVNALLVYLNVRIFYPSTKGTVRTLPLIAAILFLVHPINTESVNWISGRGDPLAAFFILIATYLVLLSMQDLTKHRLWLASLFMLLGSMSKEAAFFSFPAMALFLLLYQEVRLNSSSSPGWSWRLTAVLPFFFGGASYFFLRTASFKQVDKGITKVTDTEAYQSPITVMQQVITDFGFYIKKLFIPQPLVWSIDHVSADYFWFGIVAIILLLLLLFLRNRLMGMALLIALTIFPALLNSLLHIAWTPYAERYLYMPSAFLCIALALPPALDRSIIQKSQKILLILLICFFLPTTVSRNGLWAEPLELTRLTHQQNPGNPTIWGMYAVMLANQEHYDQARNEFNHILLKHPGHLYTHYSRAKMEMYVKDPDAARETLEKFFNKELEPNRKILQVMLESNQERLQMDKHVGDLQEIRSELIETRLMLYASNNRYEHLYEAAELAILNNDLEAAETHFRSLLERKGVPTEISAKASLRLSTLMLKEDLP
jgi:tetratricopeptide (TPR) repeat protein